MKNLTYLIIAALFASFLTNCSNDDDNNSLLQLESYETEINFGQTKYIGILHWGGDKNKITAIPADEQILSVRLVDSKEMERSSLTQNYLYIEILGTGDGETSVIVKDDEGNQAIVKVKAHDEFAEFKKDETVRLMLDDSKYRINLKEGDSNGGKYTFGREGDIVTFRWENEENGKSATITYTETDPDFMFSWDIHTDGILTLINPDAENESEKEITIELPYLKAISDKGKINVAPESEIGQYVSEKTWILFRLPAKDGQEKGTLGYLVGAVTYGK